MVYIPTDTPEVPENIALKEMMTMEEFMGVVEAKELHVAVGILDKSKAGTHFSDFFDTKYLAFVIKRMAIAASEKEIPPDVAYSQLVFSIQPNPDNNNDS